MKVKLETIDKEIDLETARKLFSELSDLFSTKISINQHPNFRSPTVPVAPPNFYPETVCNVA